MNADQRSAYPVTPCVSSPLAFPTESLSDIKYKGVSLQYKFLEKMVDFVDEQKKENECMLRYIVNRLAGKTHFKKFDMYLLKQQLSRLNIRQLKKRFLGVKAKSII